MAGSSAHPEAGLEEQSSPAPDTGPPIVKCVGISIAGWAVCAAVVVPILNQIWRARRVLAGITTYADPSVAEELAATLRASWIVAVAASSVVVLVGLAIFGSVIGWIEWSILRRVVTKPLRRALTYTATGLPPGVLLGAGLLMGGLWLADLLAIRW